MASRTETIIRNRNGRLIAPHFAVLPIETVQALHAEYGERPTRILTANRTPQTRLAAEVAGIEIMYKPIAADALEAFVLHAG